MLFPDAEIKNADWPKRTNDRLFVTKERPVKESAPQAGFTGVMTDALGRKYHYIDGVRVGQDRHAAHVQAGGRSSQAVHYKPLEPHEADAHVAGLHAKGHSDYYVSGSPADAEKFNRIHGHLMSPAGMQQTKARLERARNPERDLVQHIPTDYDFDATRGQLDKQAERIHMDRILAEKGKATFTQIEKLQNVTAQLGMQPGGEGIAHILRQEGVHGFAELKSERADELIQELQRFVGA